jgi:hypothetical protein
VIASLVFGASLVHAGPIVYAVSQSNFWNGGLGFDDGTISGTIETDGTIGTIGSSDIISYSLLLNDGIGQMFTLDPGNSSVTITGTATTATPNWDGDWPSRPLRISLWGASILTVLEQWDCCILTRYLSR